VDSGRPNEPITRWGPGSPGGRGNFGAPPYDATFRRNSLTTCYLQQPAAAAWPSGNGLVTSRKSYSASSPVSTEMGVLPRVYAISVHNQPLRLTQSLNVTGTEMSKGSGSILRLERKPYSGLGQKEQVFINISRPFQQL